MNHRSAAASVIQECFRQKRRAKFARETLRKHMLHWQKQNAHKHKTIRWTDPCRSGVNDMRSHMQCRICQDLVHAPMFCNCCATASSYGPICYSCMYNFLKLNEYPDNRCKRVRSWSPSCTLSCTFNLRSATINNTHHAEYPFFDRMRDDLGKSTCFACQQTFVSSSGLRRHLETKCAELVLTCPCVNCNFKGKRSAVSLHFRDEHEVIECPICTETVRVGMWKYHVSDHIRNLTKNLQVTQSGNWKVSASGICIRNV